MIIVMKADDIIKALNSTPAKSLLLNLLCHITLSSDKLTTTVKLKLGKLIASMSTYKDKYLYEILNN